jgi:phage terminase large subunit-like protein
MTQAVEALEISVLDRRLVHDGHPCLTWNISNAICVSDAAGNKKLDKSATRFRIDGAVALAMAIGLKSRDMKEEEKPFVYQSGSISSLDDIAPEPEIIQEKEVKKDVTEEIPCKRCEKDTRGQEFCKNCGLRVNI